MTLIASLATPEYLIQVGDTRVVRPLPQGGSELVDDDRNKLTYYDGRVAFGYCGLAELDGLRTDEWLARELTRRSYPSEAAAVQALAKGAATALKAKQLPLDQKRLAMVGVGWASDPEHDTQYPAIWRTSNFYTGSGVILTAAKEEFSTVTWTPRSNEPVTFILTGHEPPAPLVDKAKRRLRRDVDKALKPFEVLRHVVSFVREYADTTDRVGRNLVSVYIPARAKPTAVRLAGDQPTSISLCTTDSAGRPIALMVGGTLAEAAAFHHWSEGQSEPTICGPNFAVPGKGELLSALTRFLGIASQMTTPAMHHPLLGGQHRSLFRPAARLQLVPSSTRVRKGDGLTVRCYIEGLRDLQGVLAGYDLVALWDVEQLRFREIDFGAELGGAQYTDRSQTLLAAGQFNPSDPLYAAIVFSERTHLGVAELEAIQSARPTLTTLRFSVLTDGPIRVNAGFARGRNSLWDARGQPIEPAVAQALFLNEKR